MGRAQLLSRIIAVTATSCALKTTTQHHSPKKEMRGEVYVLTCMTGGGVVGCRDGPGMDD
jgi:hypothetical protein